MCIHLACVLCTSTGGVVDGGRLGMHAQTGHAAQGADAQFTPARPQSPPSRQPPSPHQQQPRQRARHFARPPISVQEGQVQRLARTNGGRGRGGCGGWLDVDMNVRVSEMLNGPRVIVFDRLWLKGLVAPTQLDFCCFGQTLVGMLLCLWRCAGPWSRLKQLAGAS